MEDEDVGFCVDGAEVHFYMRWKAMAMRMRENARAEEFTDYSLVVDALSILVLIDVRIGRLYQDSG